jgi:hypothetical protein
MINLRKLAVVAMLGLLVAPAIQGCDKVYETTYRPVNDTVRYQQLRDPVTKELHQEIRQEKIDGTWTDMKFVDGNWVPDDGMGEDPVMLQINPRALEGLE